MCIFLFTATTIVINKVCYSLCYRGYSRGYSLYYRVLCSIKVVCSIQMAYLKISPLCLLVFVCSQSTPGLRYSGATCIRFAYFMYGSGVGQLEIYTRFRGESSPVFSVSSNQGNLWFQASIDISVVYADSVKLNCIAKSR